MSSESDPKPTAADLERTETWDKPPPQAEVQGPGLSTVARTSTWSSAPESAPVTPSDWSPAVAIAAAANAAAPSTVPNAPPAQRTGTASSCPIGERTSTWSSAPDAQFVSPSDWNFNSEGGLGERTSTYGTAPDWSPGVGAAKAELGERTSTWSSAPDAKPVNVSDWDVSSSVSEGTDVPTQPFAPPSRLQASAVEFVPGMLAHQTGGTCDPASPLLPETAVNADVAPQRLSQHPAVFPKPSESKSALPPVIETDTFNEEKVSSSAASGEEKVASPDSRQRGRALLRASTVPYTAAADSEERVRPPMHLRRVQTVDMGGLTAGLVKPTRTASTERKHRKFNLLRARVEHHAEERSASLPPPPQKAPEAESVPVPSISAAIPRPANICRTVSKEVCQEVRAVVRPAKKVFARDVRRQLRLVVAGLMGSGKSTLCRMLAHLLGGVWVNQDEFSHLKKGAKRAFLAEIASVANDKKVPVLIVDKINTMRQHRTEIIEAMRRGASGDIVFVQLAHPDDQPGRLDRQLQLCLSRIRARGDGHRTLMGNDPQLQRILRMTAGGVEAMQQDELELFSAQFTVDMTLAPVQTVTRLLADLDNDGFLGRFHVEDLVTQDRLEEALLATQTAEQQLKKHEGHATVAAVGESRKKKPAPLWIWVVDYSEESKAAIRQVWATHGQAAPRLHLNADFHTTLLYLGGGSDKEIASRHWQLSGPEEVAKLREALQACEGTNVEVQITNVVWDERIAAAEVRGLEGLCANMHAHITLALREGVPPRVSNELLSRRDANEDLTAHLGHWLSQLGLAQYEAAALEWCADSGAASADEIAENAEDIAAAIEVSDEDQRARTRMMFAQAAPGEVMEAPLSIGPTLRGRIKAKRRGE